MVGIIGTGFQAGFQVKAIQAVRPIEDVWAYDVDQKKLNDFCHALDPLIPVHPAKDATEVVKRSDILVTATTSRAPVFSGKDLRPGTHINAIGAYLPTMRELDEETIRQAKVVVDTYEGCLAEAGDLLIPMQAGKFNKASIYADLGDLVTGRKKGRKNSEEVTLFKSVGFAVEDLVVAQKAYQKATQEGKGQWVEVF